MIKIIEWAHWNYPLSDEILRRIWDGENVRKFNPTSYGNNEPDDPAPDRQKPGEDDG